LVPFPKATILTVPDDYLLDAQQYRKIQRVADKALQQAEAYGVFPTPIKSIMDAAKIEEVEDDVLDESFLAKFRKKGKKVLRRALGKVIGFSDFLSRFIIVDRSIHIAKQVFVRLHETGHNLMQWHRRAYRMVELDNSSIKPDVANIFDREAQVFASIVLFQNGRFSDDAREMDFGLQTAVDLSDKYGASIYSSVWEFAAKNSRPCIVLVTSPPKLCFGDGFRARLIHKIPSPTFAQEFGDPLFPRVLTPDDDIGQLLTVSPCSGSDKKTICVSNSQGDRYECIAESYSNSHQVFVLIYPTKVLTRTISTALAC
jgi:hypothetical protein